MKSPCNNSKISIINESYHLRPPVLINNDYYDFQGVSIEISALLNNEINTTDMHKTCVASN